MIFFLFLSSYLNRYSNDQVIQTLLFLGAYSFFNYLFNIGFDWYRTFAIEERYGFNQSTVNTFVLDQLKSTLLSVVLGGAILYVLLQLYLQTGTRFILYAWFFIMLLILVINMLYTKVFIRIFNKLSPLPDGELKEKITELTRNTGYEVKK